MKLNRFFRNGLILSSGAILPIVAISCGVKQNSPELDRQNRIFVDKDAAGNIEALWAEKLLERLYALTSGTLETEFNNPESQYFKDVYQAFLSYSQFQLASDNLFFLKQVSTWSTTGIFTSEQATAINKLTAINTAPTLEQFKILYQVKATKISETLNKLLLVEKYMKIDNDQDLLKIFTDYATNKPNYDAKYYGLISYVLRKQPIQTWSFTSANAVDLFSSRNKTIATVKDFQDLFVETFEQSQSANPNLLFSANEVLETKLSGFKGLELEKARGFNLSFTLSDLRSATPNSLYGFYPNTTNGKLISVETDNNKLKSAFPLYNSTSKQLSAVYINQIAPTGKTVETKDNDGKVTGSSVVLSFDGSVYEKNLNKLIYILALSDMTLYTTAKTAFTTLGYKLQTDDETLKTTLQGSGLL